MTPGDRRSPLWVTLALGAVVGALAGFFGVGGGILIVPGLVLLTGMEQRLAHGTSLAGIPPIAAAGAVGYLLDDAVDWAAAGWLVAGSVVGAGIGSFLLARISQRWLARAFAGFLLFSAALLPFEAQAGSQAVAASWGAALALVLIGVTSGTLGGVLGVGGGIVTIPAMVLLLSLSPTVAKGTSLVVIIPTAVIATIANVRAGNADLRIGAALAATGAAAALLASFLALRVDDLVSAILFGVLLIAVAIRMLFADRAQAAAHH